MQDPLRASSALARGGAPPAARRARRRPPAPAARPTRAAPPAPAPQAYSLPLSKKSSWEALITAGVQKWSASVSAKVSSKLLVSKEGATPLFMHSLDTVCASGASGAAHWERVTLSPYASAVPNPVPATYDATRDAALLLQPYVWLQRTFVVPDTTADDTQEDESCKAARAAVKALHVEHKEAKAAHKAGAPPKAPPPPPAVKQQPPTTTQATTAAT